MIADEVLQSDLSSLERVYMQLSRSKEVIKSCRKGQIEYAWSFRAIGGIEFLAFKMLENWIDLHTLIENLLFRLPIVVRSVV